MEIHHARTSLQLVKNCHKQRCYLREIKEAIMGVRLPWVVSMSRIFRESDHKHTLHVVKPYIDAI